MPYGVSAASGTIAGVFPSLPPDGDRDHWTTGGRPGQPGASREPAGAPGRPATGGVYGAGTPVTPAAGSGAPSGVRSSGGGPGGSGPSGGGSGAGGPGGGGPSGGGPSTGRSSGGGSGAGGPGGDGSGGSAVGSTTGGITTGSRTAGHSSVGRDPVRREDPDPDEPGADHHEVDVPVVPVRRQLCIAIGGFAALLAVGLILGAQTSGPDARAPYAIVIFGVQVLFVLAWTMAMRPPALKTVASISLVVAAVADIAAVTGDTASLWPLVAVAVVGFGLALVGQLVRAQDRARIRDTVASTFLIVAGVVALATLISLTRRPAGTQAVVVFLAATGVSLAVARLIDAVFAKPRIAPQVPRGATGIVVGAMLGTLTGAILGSVLVLPFNPARGAVLGLVAAWCAGLVDLAVNYGEAGRIATGTAPTLWVARHMQGPLGAFALAAPLAYLMAVLVVT